MARFTDPESELPLVPRDLIQSQEVIGDAPFVPTNIVDSDARRARILELYDSIDQRPDDAGVAYWMGRTDLDDVELTRQFRGAVGLPYVEFEQPATDFEDRRDYVRELYREILGREPDPGGLRYWAERRTDLTGDDLRKEMRNAAIVDNQLFADPAYAAFMRASNQQAGTIEADRLQAQRNLENQRRIDAARLDRQQEIGLQKVDDAAEARGMFRSGGRIEDRAELAKDIAFQRGEQEVDFTTRGQKIQRDAAQELAKLSRQRDEQEIATRNTLTQQSIQEAARGV